MRSLIMLAGALAVAVWLMLLATVCVNGLASLLTATGG